MCLIDCVCVCKAESLATPLVVSVWTVKWVLEESCLSYSCVLTSHWKFVEEGKIIIPTLQQSFKIYVIECCMQIQHWYLCIVILDLNLPLGKLMIEEWQRMIVRIILFWWCIYSVLHVFHCTNMSVCACVHTCVNVCKAISISKSGGAVGIPWSRG